MTDKKSNKDSFKSNMKSIRSELEKSEFVKAAKETPAMYFRPITIVYKKTKEFFIKHF